MGLLDKLWDDVLAGPQPESGLGRLRKQPKPVNGTMGLEEAKLMAERQRSGEFMSQQEEARRVTQSIAISKPPPLRVDSLDPDYNSGSSTPATPLASTPTPSSSVGSPAVRERENVWASVFHPGSNKVMKKIGSDKFDKHTPNSPTVYDWLYSKDTKSSWR